MGGQGAADDDTVMYASTRTPPPHLMHTNTSSAKLLRSSPAQSSRDLRALTPLRPYAAGSLLPRPAPLSLEGAQERLLRQVPENAHMLELARQRWGEAGSA